MSKFKAAEQIHPGELLRDELEARGWTVHDLAEMTGWGLDLLRSIIDGHMPVTRATAHVLAKAFDQDAETWLWLQKAYDDAG